MEFNFKKIPNIIVTLLSSMFSGSFYIPTITDAQLSDKEQSYPLIIFSHGFAATRFVCSDYCNTMASYGFIVAAIEHRSV